MIVQTWIFLLLSAAMGGVIGWHLRSRNVGPGEQAIRAERNALRQRIATLRANRPG
jgi:50S ribosomal subunit-associated GTPase HflX